MGADSTNLYELIGSRICHDLVSPIGAIANGVELLGMSGGGDSGPELDLINQSVENASARIKLFRIAFGVASAEQMVGHTEIQGVISDYFEPTRLSISAAQIADCPRPEVKVLFLLLLCAESAMPYGGTIRVTRTDRVWHVSGEAEKMKTDPSMWSWFAPGPMPEPTAALVHFALLSQLSSEKGRTVHAEYGADKISLSF
ncbi:histidine phosphotransferase family protein [Actibacterium sp. 188UL27-1]|uniref:histidine phosphotransferase family protein n=1 Tax=Actibacterium sp. 188UL27-1 TaxID=2786961 RepID=UPI00195F0DDC|nr:histidine phosphotransferase family protein [Actibacterium sp. 188UL27-1]MBM7067605.1 histidine phosphotransferase [Actibacterium sp. 188UL27-1]